MSEGNMFDKMFGAEGSQMGEIGKEVLNTILSTGLLKKADMFIPPLLEAAGKFLGDGKLLLANSNESNGKKEMLLTIIEKELADKILALVIEEATKNPELLKVHSINHFANMVKELNVGEIEDIDDVENKMKQIGDGTERPEVDGETKE